MMKRIGYFFGGFLTAILPVLFTFNAILFVFTFCKTNNPFVAALHFLIIILNIRFATIEFYRIGKAISENESKKTLPLAIGSPIYRTDEYGSVVPFEVDRIVVYMDAVSIIDDGNNEFTLDEIGKSVFITPEEAIKAYKRRGMQP